jgi:hypothetical protein
MTSPAPHSRMALLALGVALGRAGTMAKLAIGIGALTCFGTAIVALVMAQTEAHPPLENLPGLTADLLAWGAGVLLAFAATAHALRRDREQGIQALLRSRGGDAHDYVWGRVGGLAILLGIVVGGGTLFTGIVATLAARHFGLAAQTLQATVAGLAFAIAFSATLAPIAMAALGARSRAGGYAWLVGILVLPELLAGWTGAVLPRTWSSVLSIPSALSTLRTSLMPSAVDVAAFARAFVVLAVVCVLALIFVHSQLARVERETALGPP